MIEPTNSTARRCEGCGARLAADNTARTCSKCLRDQLDQLTAPPAHLKDEFFETNEFKAAFDSHHIGKVFKSYRNHPRLIQMFGRALNQEILGHWLGITQSQVSRIENGEPEENIRTLCNYAEILHLPKGMLWWDFPGESRRRSVERIGASDDNETVVDIRDIEKLASEILESSTASEAIDQLVYATTSLAEAHTQAPARHVLRQVLSLHGQAQVLLRAKQRLSQRREIYRIESDLLAHACLLLDDLKQNGAAQTYGNASLAFANEGGSGQAMPRTALAKALRWAERLIESADMAKIGYQSSGLTPIRTQLASQEANAAALMGNMSRAQEALKRAEVAAETVPEDSGTSAWSFPVGRQAIFALSVALQAGDPDAALEAVAKADANWASGSPLVTANWAQIRTGASIAHLLKGSLDAAIDEVAPVLDLTPDLRISTVTAYTQRLDRQLNSSRFEGSGDAVELRARIREFNSAALPPIDQPGV